MHTHQHHANFGHKHSHQYHVNTSQQHDTCTHAQGTYTLQAESELERGEWVGCLQAVIGCLLSGNNGLRDAIANAPAMAGVGIGDASSEMAPGSSTIVQKRLARTVGGEGGELSAAGSGSFNREGSAGGAAAMAAAAMAAAANDVGDAGLGDTLEKLRQVSVDRQACLQEALLQAASIRFARALTDALVQ